MNAEPKQFEIAPIPTTWGGVTFRSRTEARWAVFFDALKVRADYEAEGFELPNGVWYLPDFWIPEWKIFIEVKGQEPTHEERGKAGLLAFVTGKPVLFAVGAPSRRLGELAPTNSFDSDVSEWCWGRIEGCRRCDGYVLAAYQSPDEAEAFYAQLLGKHENPDRCSDKMDGAGFPRAAMERAIAERFGT